jgi:hypothetical protein
MSRQIVYQIYIACIIIVVNIIEFASRKRVYYTYVPAKYTLSAYHL